MNNLNLFMQCKININLKTLLEGIYLSYVTGEEIFDFAFSKVEEDPENVDPCYLELACLDKPDLINIRDILTNYVDKRENLIPQSLEQEKTKWMVVLSKKMMDHLSDDVLQAILEIGSFWNDWKYPVEGIVDRNYGNDPSTYFTEKTLKDLKSKYYIWFDKQLKELSTSP